jgi:hypothetical protein
MPTTLPETFIERNVEHKWWKVLRDDVWIPAVAAATASGGAAAPWCVLRMERGHEQLFDPAEITSRDWGAMSPIERWPAVLEVMTKWFARVAMRDTQFSIKRDDLSVRLNPKEQRICSTAIGLPRNARLGEDCVKIVAAVFGGIHTASAVLGEWLTTCSKADLSRLNLDWCLPQLCMQAVDRIALQDAFVQSLREMFTKQVRKGDVMPRTARAMELVVNALDSALDNQWAPQTRKYASTVIRDFTKFARQMTSGNAITTTVLAFNAWPTLRIPSEPTLRLPPDVQRVIAETNDKAAGMSRKLTWFNHVGRVVVRDTVQNVRFVLKPIQAVALLAFNVDGARGDSGVTIEQLSAEIYAEATADIAERDSAALAAAVRSLTTPRALRTIRLKNGTFRVNPKPLDPPCEDTLVEVPNLKPTVKPQADKPGAAADAGADMISPEYHRELIRAFLVRECKRQRATAVDRASLVGDACRRFSHMVGVTAKRIEHHLTELVESDYLKVVGSTQIQYEA